MANVIFNRVVQTVASAPGTGNITLSNAVAGYQTLAQAGSVDATTTAYLAEDGTMWEYGSATISSSGTVLARSVTRSYNGSTFGSSAVSLTANAIITITPRAEDLTSASTINSGVLAVSYGGTGLTSLTAGYIPFGGSTTYSSDSSLFWDNTNKRLGVGTTSPISKLNVVSGSGATLAQVNIGYGGSNNYYDADSHFFRNAATTGQVTIDSAQRITAGALSVSTGSSPNIAAITTGYGGSNNYYDANTHIWRNGSSSETMRISGGLVGIGVSSPYGNIDVATSAGRIFFLGNSGANFIGSVNSANNAYVDLQLNGATTQFFTAGVERARIDAAGNLGLGVTPSYKFDVVANSDAIGVNICGRSDGISVLRFANNSNVENARIDTRSDGTIYFSNTSSVATRMVIDSSGNLLVGTTSSGASKLVVNDSSIQINTAKTPASATATGTQGQVCWDSSYIYVCTATNTWKRAAIASW
jgi:hypothetical protein